MGGRGGGISRGKRQAVSSGLLNPSEEDKMDFMEDLADFKEGWENKLGNLSCVLTQLDMLDAAGNINMNKFSYQSMANVLKDSPAGSDPAFVKKIADGYSDCYDISRSWPQQALDRHPVMKEHGRHMIFFECSKKIQTQMCSKFQIAQWMDVLYGKHDSASSAEKRSRRRCVQSFRLPSGWMFCTGSTTVPVMQSTVFLPIGMMRH